MVLTPSTEAVVVLEHERWAAPLADLAAQALGRDIERRRADVLVGEPRGSQSGHPPVKVWVDIVQMTVRRGDRVSLEVHWRVSGSSAQTDAAGRDVFSAPAGGQDYTALAEALSECLAQLAERLAGLLPRAP